MKFLVQQQPAFVSAGFPDAPSHLAVGRPSVILIHGAANDHRVWQDPFNQNAALQAKLGTNLLAVDLPGHGQTFAAAKPTIEAYADWIINLLDNGAIENATLIGHSMGSLIALDCARRYPTRVLKLGLIGTGLPMPVSDSLLKSITESPDAAIDQLVRWNFYMAKNDDGTFPPPTARMHTYRALLAAARSGVMVNDLKACADYQPTDAELGAITQPTSILASLRDKMASPDGAKSLASKLPAATLTMIDHAGHAMMQDAPDEVAAWLEALLKSP
jgi:pimeloyl-ACP methyl ester carboxylesterase